MKPAAFPAVSPDAHQRHDGALPAQEAVCVAARHARAEEHRKQPTAAGRAACASRPANAGRPPATVATFAPRLVTMGIVLKRRSGRRYPQSWVISRAVGAAGWAGSGLTGDCAARRFPPPPPRRDRDPSPRCPDPAARDRVLATIMVKGRGRRGVRRDPQVPARGWRAVGRPRSGDHERRGETPVWRPAPVPRWRGACP